MNRGFHTTCVATTMLLGTTMVHARQGGGGTNQSTPGSRGGANERRGLSRRAAETRLMVNGRPAEGDAGPVTVNGQVMVPLRFVAQYLGGQVEWLPEERMAKVMRGPQTFSMTVGSTRAMRNTTPVALPSPPVMREGRTYIPLREVGRFFEAAVNYNAQTRTVFVTAPTAASPPTPGAQP